MKHDHLKKCLNNGLTQPRDITAVSPVLLSECLRIQIERMYPSILPKRLIWYEQQLEQLPPNPRELFPCSVRGWIRNVINSAFKEDSQYARRS